MSRREANVVLALAMMNGRLTSLDLLRVKFEAVFLSESGDYDLAIAAADIDLAKKILRSYEA